MDTSEVNMSETNSPFVNRIPEKSKYDQSRHANMRIRDIRYGFFRVVSDVRVFSHCDKCGKELTGQLLKINGIAFCYSGCF